MGSGPPVFVEKLTWDNAYEIMLCRLESTLQMEWAVHVTMSTWKPQASPAWQRWRRGAVGWWVCCVESSDMHSLFGLLPLPLFFTLLSLFINTHLWKTPNMLATLKGPPGNGDRCKTSDDLYKNRRGVHTSHVWEAFLQEVIFKMNWKKSGNLLSYARGSELWAGEQTLGSYFTSLSFGFLLWRTYLTTEWDSTCQVPSTEPDL